MDTKVKTQSVTNTQIAVAVGVALLAGGLAFAAAPNRKNRGPACTTQSIEFVDSCSKGGKYRSANYVCSDGSSGQAPGKGCRTANKIQQAVDRACSRKQCTASPAPAAPLAPVAPVILEIDTPVVNPIAEVNQCGLQDIRFGDSCGKNKYEKVEFTCTDGYSSSHNTKCSSLSDLQSAAVVACSYRDCQVRQITNTSIPSETDTRTNAFIPVENSPSPQVVQNVGDVQNVSPIVFISGSGLAFRSEGSGKVVISVPLANRGTGPAGSDVKYSLYFLDSQKNIVESVDLNLSSSLDVGDEKMFETVMPIPAQALFAQVVVDKAFSDGKDNDFTSMIPTDLFIR